jgi:hypothetical protein
VIDTISRFTPPSSPPQSGQHGGATGTATASAPGASSVQFGTENTLAGLAPRWFWVRLVRSSGKRGCSASAFQLLDFGPEVARSFGADSEGSESIARG